MFVRMEPVGGVSHFSAVTRGTNVASPTGCIRTNRKRLAELSLCHRCVGTDRLEQVSIEISHAPWCFLHMQASRRRKTSNANALIVHAVELLDVGEMARTLSHVSAERRAAFRPLRVCVRMCAPLGEIEGPSMRKLTCDSRIARASEFKLEQW